MPLTATSTRSTDGSLPSPRCCERTAIASPAPDQPIIPALLADTDVFVIANAVKGGESCRMGVADTARFRTRGSQRARRVGAQRRLAAADRGPHAVPGIGRGSRGCIRHRVPQRLCQEIGQRKRHVDLHARRRARVGSFDRPRPQRSRADHCDQGLHGSGISPGRAGRAADADAARTGPCSFPLEAGEFTTRLLRNLRAACCRARCCVTGGAAWQCSARPPCSRRSPRSTATRSCAWA